MCRFHKELSRASWWKAMLEPYLEGRKKNSEKKKLKEETGEIEWSKVKLFVIIPFKGWARSSKKIVLISEDKIFTSLRTSQEIPHLKFHRITEKHYSKNQVSKTRTSGGHIQTLKPKETEQRQLTCHSKLSLRIHDKFQCGVLYKIPERKRKKKH